MREILFRGKRENKNWTYGYYVFQKKRSGCFGQTITANDFDRHYIVTPRGKSFCVLPETVGQYTGLTDKNGIKIFEGDIVRQKTTPEFAKVNSFEWECYGIVRFGYCDWNEGNAEYSSIGWYIEPLKSISIAPKDYLVGNIQPGLNQNDINNKYYPMEVIGNIYDNPELLNCSEFPNS